jgi:hypothetical protein
MSKNVTIRITVDCESMVDFFQNDTSYGTRNKPCRADSFCEVAAVGATSTGIRNVFKLASDTEYQFQLTNANSNTDIDCKTATLTLAIIQANISTENEWAKIIDLSYSLPPEFNVNGSLIYKPVQDKDGNYIFIIKTQPDGTFEQNYNLQYTITFQVLSNEKSVLAVIDPLIANTSDD